MFPCFFGSIYVGIRVETPQVVKIMIHVACDYALAHCYITIIAIRKAYCRMPSLAPEIPYFNPVVGSRVIAVKIF